MNVLVTGAAGFIGSAVALALLRRGDDVTGVDILSDYYDVALKRARLQRIEEAVAGTANGGNPAGKFRFEKIDLADRGAVAALFAAGGFDRVVHLAAQPGVRSQIFELS